MTPLDRKLLRDLWRIKGQAIAIGLVIALGTMMIVMMGGLVSTLENTRAAYFERYRLADAFAPVVRAPSRIIDDLADIEGVTAVEGRISAAALVDMPDEDLPIRARAVSLPGAHQPRLNHYYLSAGRNLNPDRRQEILLLQAFATAHGLEPGDSLSVTMNGVNREFTIVGLARSPEFLYTTAPGEFLPDDARYAVIWVNEAALAAAYDLEGAFNEAIFALGGGVNESNVLKAIDRMLDPYGGRGAYVLADQISNKFVSQEILGLRSTMYAVPPIFLGVAAFLLFIVITRTIQAEREEIGLLKAFGYSSAEVSLHYLKFVLVIAVLGALAGSAFGVMAGRAMAEVYQLYFKFPFLVFSLQPSTFVIAMVVSVASAVAGSLLVLRRVFRLSPAVAMRPPAPADYSRSRQYGGLIKRLLDQPSRMVLRRATRHPFRVGGAVLGIATGMGLAVSTIGMMAAFERTLDTMFSVIDRSDATVSFGFPMSSDALFDIQRIDGVISTEPFRAVSAIFRFGTESYRGGIEALTSEPRLYRAMDEDEQPIILPSRGIVLSQPVADILGAKAGDNIVVEVREGRRPTLILPVARVSQSLLGAPTYMSMEALNKALREPDRISGAFVTIDAARQDEVYRHLKDTPAVAGVALKANTRRAFQKQMDTGAGAMRYVMAAVAAVIAFGIVYNSARIAFAERVRDLASLRVMGFTRGEAAFVLLGELGLVTLVALPIGSAIGYGLSFAIAKAFSTDLYQIPVFFSPESYGTAMLAVVIASIISGALVRRDLDRIELVTALKTRE